MGDLFTCASLWFGAVLFAGVLKTANFDEFKFLDGMLFSSNEV